MDDLEHSLDSLSIDQSPIYLLKTRSSPSDAYESHFTNTSSGKQVPIFVPVLEHVFRDDALRTLRRHAERFAFAGGSSATKRQIATNNPAKKYGGMIFTSQRAVDAFAIVVSKLDPSKLGAMFDKEMPLYVVGPATATGVKSLGLPCPVLGEETGSGEVLAKFILEHQRTLARDVTHLERRRLPLLFLVGEQRRDIIPKSLSSETLPPSEKTQVIELIVYETGEMATFEESFSTLLQQAAKQKIKQQWVVVFSPQGCEAMLTSLRWLDESTGRFSQSRRVASQSKSWIGVATIGPTTRDYLKEAFAFTADVCAETPTPEGVSEGVKSFENQTP
ncbi:hypothetical protein B0A48_03316 [Cryoendolithus antarcticus]|uniref:Tetrapyrrole biosynthesis uroporphyrinogen III synthase domain-containing protein n=1 Tax=Cryoendolithus antarcticus TaxID=1507870 RepID=A0A1V8TJN8_9PEZI|nr:hypothetical protein B0A48_03316 [Cryoendolithus antarcticus]